MWWGDDEAQQTPVYLGSAVWPGEVITGPRSSSFRRRRSVVYPGWAATARAGRLPAGTRAAPGNSNRPEATQWSHRSSSARGDPIDRLAVVANRLDGICREMTNTLLRPARSSVINQARDFSCAIVTADTSCSPPPRACPVHIMGSQACGRAMSQLHDDLAEGDAFLHNDPYLGNTHSADHTHPGPRLR